MGDSMINEIFYNEILEEAKSGRVDCGFIYNVIFQTILPDKQYYVLSEFPNLQIPTLYISNKKEFELLLQKYVEIAYPFYDKNYFDNEHDYIKAIITFLFTNMTVEEFLHPNDYLQKRISFLQNKTPYNIGETIELGNSEYIGNITATLNNEPIYEEAPYSLDFQNDNSKFPTVRFGIDNDTVYIYAIQNSKDAIIDKKTNRKLYKINDKFDTSNESYDNINDYENLTGVTNSTIVSATLALSFFLKLGYTDIRIPSFLPTRFNAKEMAREKKMKMIRNVENFNEIEQEAIEKNMNIQRNISDKFIRTFRRLDYHFDNININCYPFDVDSYLHLTMNDEVHCENDLLNDLFMCGYNSTKRK